LRDAKLYEPYHAALTAAGYVVLTFDYRGFGGSEGDASYLDPGAQVEDIRAATDYLESRDDIDVHRIGVFGSGGTGGGNAIVAAALDDRLKTVVSQVPIADGRDWLHRMRREHEWVDFLSEVRRDARERAIHGTGRRVPPRDGIMIPTPERTTHKVKADVDHRIPALVELASADAILNYRPLDFVARIAPRALMLICVENDATTPEDHAYALYEKAGPPKCLVTQSQTSHYGAYARNAVTVSNLIVDWFDRHLPSGAIRVEEQLTTSTETFAS
jgi:dipeptidyl aminopeptidase/acylaminoacyl peptidase